MPFFKLGPAFPTSGPNLEIDPFLTGDFRFAKEDNGDLSMALRPGSMPRILRNPLFRNLQGSWSRVFLVQPTYKRLIIRENVLARLSKLRISTGIFRKAVAQALQVVHWGTEMGINHFPRRCRRKVGMLHLERRVHCQF